MSAFSQATGVKAKDWTFKTKAKDLAQRSSANVPLD